MSSCPVPVPIHAVTVATYAHPGLAVLLRSAAGWSVPVTVLGMELNRKEPQATKPHLLLTWLTEGVAAGTIAPTDLVLFVDGFDVVFRGGLEAVRAAWEGAGSPDVFLSAESNCWPDPSLKPWFDARFPTKKYRYVNSGTYTARAGVLKELLSCPSLPTTGGDQIWWTRQFMSTTGHGFVLDTDRVLAAAVFGDDVLTILSAKAPIVHFNGSKTPHVTEAVLRIWDGAVPRAGPDTTDSVCAELTRHVQAAVARAETLDSKLAASDAGRRVLAVQGLCAPKTRHFYNNLLAGYPDVRYLEIGVWKGASFCAAIFGNAPKLAVAVDNFRHEGNPRPAFRANLAAHAAGVPNIHVVDKDAFAVRVAKDLPPGARFNFYMYDAAHGEADHYMALAHYVECLDDVFVFVVDDWNRDHVRAGTHRALRDLQAEVVFQHEIRTTNDGSEVPPHLAHTTWWNGIYIAVVRKAGRH